MIAEYLPALFMLVGIIIAVVGFFAPKPRMVLVGILILLAGFWIRDGGLESAGIPDTTDANLILYLPERKKLPEGMTCLYCPHEKEDQP